MDLQKHSSVFYRPLNKAWAESCDREVQHANRRFMGRDLDLCAAMLSVWLGGRKRLFTFHYSVERTEPSAHGSPRRPRGMRPSAASTQSSHRWRHSGMYWNVTFYSWRRTSWSLTRFNVTYGIFKIEHHCLCTNINWSVRFFILKGKHFLHSKFWRGNEARIKLLFRVFRTIWLRFT